MRPIIFIILLFSFLKSHSQDFTNTYPFNLPWNDGTSQDYLPDFSQNTINQRVVTVGDQFTVGGEPIKFWGVNITTGACFPPKSMAPSIASRMRKMGINLVRFHHMDNGWTTNIFDESNGTTRVLDAEVLDRLFFFVNELKKNNIYSNINLNVSRDFTEQDGVVSADSLVSFAKGLTLFDPKMIELQKEFATQLLTTMNPYTGMSLANDPAVALLEIDNENVLYGGWTNDDLFSFDEGGIIPIKYSRDLDVLWNQFLVDKYQNQTALLSAWGDPSQLNAPELLQDPNFELNDINQNWILELHESAAATMTISSDAYEGNYCADLNITQTSFENWHIQFQQVGFSFEKDTTYTVSFAAKSDNSNPISVNFMQNSAPWNWYSGNSFDLTTEWKTYSFTFKANETNMDNVRLTLSFENNTGHFYFDDFSLKKSIPTGLDSGENLSNLNIRRIKYFERFAYSEQRVIDNTEFYMELQKAYYDDMAVFLKNDLNVKSAITGTNALGGIHECYTAENMDYIDDHAYWQHPQFPNEPWSGTDWFIGNDPMLGSEYLGVVPYLFGGYQMQNKPYTISEYNHAYPNIYQIEMLPIIAGYSSFHGADGIMFFEYNGGESNAWEEDQVLGFFELHRNNAIMAQFPLYAYAFRNELIQEDPNPILVDYSMDWLYKLSLEDDSYRWGKYFPYDKNLALTHAIKTTGFDHNQVDFPANQVELPYTSATQELSFDTNKNLLHIQADQFSAYGGALQNANNPNANMSISGASNFGLVSWLSLTNTSLNDSQKSILAISSRIQNTNMQWDGDNTIHANWGESPTQMEVNTMTVSLKMDADYITVYPLDNLGVANTGIDIYPTNGIFEIEIDQSVSKTPWFGIYAHGVTATDNPDLETAAIYPNPVRDSFYIDGKETISALQIFSIAGVKMKTIQNLGVGQMIDVSDLVSGVYILELETLNGKEWYKLVVE